MANIEYFVNEVKTEPARSSRPEGVHEEAGWLSEYRYPPRWITRHKPGGVGGILQGRSWHGDRGRDPRPIIRSERPPS
jgi:hypothetical protein